MVLRLLYQNELLRKRLICTVLMVINAPKHVWILTNLQKRKEKQTSNTIFQSPQFAHLIRLVVGIQKLRQPLVTR